MEGIRAPGPALTRFSLSMAATLALSTLSHSSLSSTQLNSQHGGNKIDEICWHPDPDADPHLLWLWSHCTQHIQYIHFSIADSGIAGSASHAGTHNRAGTNYHRLGILPACQQDRTLLHCFLLLVNLTPSSHAWLPITASSATEANCVTESSRRTNARAGAPRLMRRQSPRDPEASRSGCGELMLWPPQRNHTRVVATKHMCSVHSCTSAEYLAHSHKKQGASWIPGPRVSHDSGEESSWKPEWKAQPRQSGSLPCLQVAGPGLLLSVLLS